MEKKQIDIEFIPYEQALELKELGFNETCIGYYYSEKTYLNSQGVNVPGPSGEQPLPLYQQAFRWFREKHGLFTSFYEETELECLKKLIEIVKQHGKETDRS